METYYDVLTKYEWSKKRPPLPPSVSELFQDYKTSTKFKKVFVTLTAYLSHLYRERLYKRGGGGSSGGAQRASTTTKRGGGGGGASSTSGGDSSSEETPMTAAEINGSGGGGGGRKESSSPKLSSGVLIDGLVYQARLNVIPEELMNYESPYICVAIAAFCLKCNKDQFAVNLIYALLEKTIKVGKVDNFVRILKDTPKQLKSQVERARGTAAAMGTTLSREQVNVVVRALLIVADILRDKNYAKLAMAMDAEVYVANLTNARSFRTINPYEPLITYYIVECVALKNHDEVKQRVFRQFKVNPTDTIDKIIGEIPSFASKREKRDARKLNSSGRQRFDDKKEYFIYKSRENFTKDIAYMSRELNGEGYYILTYNDCVFDVLGGGTTRMNWQKRLDMAPADCTKICIQRVSGEELNKINENATVGISWFDDESGEVKYIVETFSRKRSNDTAAAAAAANGTTTTTTIANGSIDSNNIIGTANSTDDSSNGGECVGVVMNGATTAAAAAAVAAINSNNKYCDIKAPAAKRFKSGRLPSVDSIDK